MKENNYIKNLIQRYPTLNIIESEIIKAFELLCDCYKKDGKLLVAGNGGSASDAEHIVGELMKGFVKRRKLSDDFSNKLCDIDKDLGRDLSNMLQQPLPAMTVMNQIALTTAFSNDVSAEIALAQQVLGYGNLNDVFLGITTSGNSKNILYGVVTAKAKGMKTIALTGGDGGNIKKLVDVSICVPEKETYKIQELHLPIYHTLCLMLEEYFY